MMRQSERGWDEGRDRSQTIKRRATALHHKNNASISSVGLINNVASNFNVLFNPLPLPSQRQGHHNSHVNFKEINQACTPHLSVTTKSINGLRFVSFSLFFFFFLCFLHLISFFPFFFLPFFFGLDTTKIFIREY